jgi:alkylhydroperoxidase family enzyme
MARVPYLEKSDLAPEHQPLMSRNITLYRALAHSPGALKHMSGVGAYIRHQSTLDPNLRELAILQVGYLARSPYEWSHHVKIGHDFGLSDDDIRAIAEETAGRPSKLDPLARLVLRAAREITNDLTMTEATFAALGAQLSREHLVDLTMVISFYNAVVRVLATLQIDVEPEYQKYLVEHPLPRGEPSR